MPPPWARSAWSGRLRVSAISRQIGGTDMLMRKQQYRAIRNLRHQQQCDHIRRPDLPGRLQWSRRALAIFQRGRTKTDMLMRNDKTGQFELYDISNNHLTSAAPMGQVGLEWSVAGFGDFSGNANETDMPDAQHQYRRHPRFKLFATTPSPPQRRWGKRVLVAGCSFGP